MRAARVLLKALDAAGCDATVNQGPPGRVVLTVSEADAYLIAGVLNHATRANESNRGKAS